MILDGKKLRDELLVQYKEKIKEEKLNITLAIILVGNNEASKLYIKNKEKYCTEVGIKVDKYLLDEDISEKVLINLIKDLNEDEKVTGIILQSPVPDGIDFDKSEDKRSAPNGMSVKEARKIFEEDGVCVPGFKHLVRDPIDDELPENNE